MFRNKARVEAYEFGPFRLDLTVCQLFQADNPVHLSPKTLDILRILVANQGQIVTKEELVELVWPGRFVEHNNLTVRMSALRKALGENLQNRLIETVPGDGYRFVGRVKQIISASRAGGDFDSLAVLPLVATNNPSKLEYVCDGIVESLITSLSHIGRLRVMARSTVFRYKGREIDARKIGKELGVRAVLVGTVRQSGSSLVFDVEMIDSEDGAHLWGAKYTRQISDLLVLQEDLAKEITENLRVRLNSTEEGKMAKRYTDDPRAYQLYLKGRYFWGTRTVAGVKKAIKCFREATTYDPKYSLAFAGIADAYFLFSNCGLRPPRETVRKARKAALKALEIDAELGEAHVSLGNIKSSFDLDWAGAEKEFKLAIELNPYYPPARHYYANFLAKVGRLNEALAEIEAARDLDPSCRGVNLTMGKIYYFLRRYDEAIKKAQDMLEFEPNFGLANGLKGITHIELGRHANAVRELKSMIGLSAGDYRTRGGAGSLSNSDPEAIALLGYAYARQGKHRKARQLVDDLVKLKEKSYLQPHNLALIYIGLGEKDKAFEWLEKALADNSSTLTFIKVSPLFDSLREDARYVRLVQQLGLES